MGPIPFAAGAAVFAAAVLASPAMAQWNNQPYSYRGANPGAVGAGMSTAYRQAIIDRELFGREPRNLVRSADGRLLDVIERDNQAFVAEREPNILVGRDYGPPLAGVRLRAGTAGVAVAIDGWTAMLDSIRPLE